jgi:hypothetical protein
MKPVTKAFAALKALNQNNQNVTLLSEPNLNDTFISVISKPWSQWI